MALYVLVCRDKPGSLEFQLEGRLVGAWVAELEQCWTTAASIRNGTRLVAARSRGAPMTQPASTCRRRSVPLGRHALEGLEELRRLRRRIGRLLGLAQRIGQSSNSSW